MSRSKKQYVQKHFLSSVNYLPSTVEDRQVIYLFIYLLLSFSLVCSVCPRTGSRDLGNHIFVLGYGGTNTTPPESKCLYSPTTPRSQTFHPQCRWELVILGDRSRKLSQSLVPVRGAAPSSTARPSAPRETGRDLCFQKPLSVVTEMCHLRNEGLLLTYLLSFNPT